MLVAITGGLHECSERTGIWAWKHPHQADGSVTYTKLTGDVRHSLGIVLQDTNLFTGTVMDNIRYGKLDATDEDCISAAKLAGADDFITRLPDCYETLLTENGAIFNFCAKIPLHFS